MTALLLGVFFMGLFVLALAAAAAALFYVVAWLFTWNAAEGRRQFLRSVVLVSFLSAAWIGAVILAQLAVNLSDANEAALRLELPGGYTFAVEKGANKGRIAGSDGRTRIVNLRRIQVSGDYVLGTRFLADQSAQLRGWYPNGLAGPNLILDTRTGTEIWLRKKAFEAKARRLGVSVALRPVAELRKDRPPGLPSGLTAAIAFSGPLAGLALLVLQGMRLRRNSAPTAR